MVQLYLAVVLRHFRKSTVTSSDLKKKLKSPFHLLIFKKCWFFPNSLWSKQSVAVGWIWSRGF